jgi:hypothetical protein
LKIIKIKEDTLDQKENNMPTNRKKEDYVYNKVLKTTK